MRIDPLGQELDPELPRAYVDDPELPDRTVVVVVVVVMDFSVVIVVGAPLLAMHSGESPESPRPDECVL